MSLLAIILVSQQGATAPAKAATDFPTKNIILILPASPGGGFDTMGRMLASIWPKYLSNNVSVVVENVEGAGWNRGLLRAWKAKPDGYTLTFLNVPGNLTNQVTQAVDFDLTKYEIIGQFNFEGMMAVASKKSGLKKPEDFKGKSLKAAFAGFASTGALGQLVAADGLGFKQTAIQHKGPAEEALSVVRGDTDWAILSPPAIKGCAGDMQLLWAESPKRFPGFPDVPTITELGYPHIDAAQLHRMVGAPPGTPKEVLNILRASFKKAVEDPQFAELLKKTDSEPGYLSPEDSLKAMKDGLAVITKYKEAIVSGTK